MSDALNPYAPPTVAETEACTTRYWHVDGIDLMAKNGATLPKVDLDTGVSEGDFKCVPRVLQVFNAPGFVTNMVVIFAVTFLMKGHDLAPFAIIAFAIVISFIGRIGVFRRNLNSRIQVWSFVEERRAKRDTLRRRLRIGVLFLTAAMLMTGPVFLSSGMENYATWITRFLMAGFVIILALAIWALIDRPKSRNHSAAPGWLRISGLHPDALAFLLRCEDEQAAHFPDRKRLVRTVYLHRYPLRVLIGKNLRHPLLVIRIVLMKLLRSRLLEREAFHFSEAEEIPFENLCPQLRAAIASWLSALPDWISLIGERLPSPAGDLISESATLVSPGFEHCIHINRSWMARTPEKGSSYFSFSTWLADETLISTHDYPQPLLRDPHLRQHTVTGPPERVFEAHLRHLAGEAILPSHDLPQLRARLQSARELSARLATEAGLQSETREAY
jgi:hypothetical protein